MEQHNIDLQTIKLAFFDFDETLAIHLNDPPEWTEGNPQLYAKAYNDPESFYDKIVPCKASDSMINIVCYCFLMGIKTFCLSGMSGSVHLEAKKAFVKKYYRDDIEFLMSAGQANKIKVVKAIMHAYNCEPSQIVHFDDNPDIVKEMKQNGFLAVNVSALNNILINGRKISELCDDAC